MSKNEKKKRAHVHVDQLIVKADKVTIVEHEEKKKEAGTEERYVRDPWGFFPRQRTEEVEERTEEKANEKSGEEEEKRGWSWI